jgi:NTE family protein
LKNQYGDEYEKWYWIRNEAYIQSVWKDKFAIGGGISYDFFNNKDIFNYSIDKKTYLNAYVFIKSDTQDDKEFPTRGIYLNAEGKIIDLLNNNLAKKTIQTKASLTLNFPLTEWLTYRMNMFGGFTIGNTLPSFYQYRYGGMFEQNIVNFISFNGHYFGQNTAENMLTTNFALQGNYNKKFFLTGNLNVLNSFSEINSTEIFRIKTYSIGLTMGYKSPFGQIKINYSTDINNSSKIFNIILGHWF